MTTEDITFVVGSMIVAYAIGWAGAASITYFKQFMEKIQ